MPISQRLLGPVLDPTQDLTSAISELGVPQIAALILLQYLPKMAASRQLSPDLVMIEVIRSGQLKVEREGLAAFILEARSILERAQIVAGHALLSVFGIELLDDAAVAQKGYLTSDGQWDSSFHERQRVACVGVEKRIVLPNDAGGTLTIEQSRVFREFKAQADDHLHVQGYAGTGKSHLIRALLAMLQSSRARVLVLADRPAQLKALMRGQTPSEQVYPRTFGWLMSEMVPADRIDPSNRRVLWAKSSAGTVSDTEIAQYLAITAYGGMEPRSIAQAARSAIRSFCYTDDERLELKHLPGWWTSRLDATTRPVALHYATELWNAMLQPASSKLELPLRVYHRIKWAALNDWRVPSRYTHVLVDECHDLSKPMIQILERSPQAWISLGDEYQSLKGWSQRRSNVVRQREVTYSVRSGQQIEVLVNPIISRHPGHTKLPFHGNPVNKTEINYYEKPTVPEHPAVILVRDMWGLIEWTQRLTAANVGVELMSDAATLNMFVTDCVELYQRKVRPRHAELYQFGSWDDLAHRHHHHAGFQRIERMLTKGFGYEDWKRTMARLTIGASRPYALARVEDVRNREFDTVMLAPELVEDVRAIKGAAFAEVGSTLYVALTRARRRLILPRRVQYWIEEIGAGVHAPTSRST